MLKHKTGGGKFSNSRTRTGEVRNKINLVNSSGKPAASDKWASVRHNGGPGNIGRMMSAMKSSATAPRKAKNGGKPR